jgi:hypothetical protein
MKLVADIRDWHKWWSVRLGILSGACFAAAKAYTALNTMAPQLVAGVPQWILTGLTTAAMGLAAGGFIARFVDQAPAAKPTPTVPAPRIERQPPC